MSRLSSRRIPPSSVFTEEELDNLLGQVQSYFGKPWLSAAESHPLQALWHRADELASIELLNLGFALREMASRDVGWVREQVRLVQGKDEQNSRGALFEILGLAHFRGGNTTMTPAKRSQPGFDGTLRFEDGARMTLSLKRYGQSTYHKDFLRGAEVFRRHVERSLQRVPTHGLRLTVLCERTPALVDWRLLTEHVSRDITRIAAGGRDTCGDTWTLWSHQLREEFPRLASTHRSTVVLVLSRQHPNESQNLHSKLEDACRNLSRHAPTYDARNANAVYLHLDADAPLRDCEQWASQWMDEHEDKPISTVLLYQPSVVRNGNESVVYHCFRNAVSRRHVEWRRRAGGTTPSISIPVGRVGTEPAEAILEWPDGRSFPTGSMYLYQGGDIYQEGEPDGSSQIGHLQNFRSGVHIHSVIEPLRDGRKILFSGRFAPSDDLLIL